MAVEQQQVNDEAIVSVLTSVWVLLSLTLCEELCLSVETFFKRSVQRLR